MTGDQDVLSTWGPLFCFGLFIGMLALHDLGRLLGARRRAKDPEGSRLGLGPVESATFGLLGLLIAFTFSGAATRFDARRHLVTEEANFIGTAWLRIDLLPASEQPPVRTLFRNYLDSRLAIYERLPDLAAASAELERSTMLQEQLWKETVAATQRAGSNVTTGMLLSAINSMIDITTTRTMVTRMHPPGIIYGMLFAAALMAALLAGYNSAGGKTRSLLHSIGLAGIVTIALYVIIDLEHPRFGFVRIESVDEVLRDLRRTMN